MLVREAEQAATAGQGHDRDQSGGRHEIRVVEPRRGDGSGVRELHLRDALRGGRIVSVRSSILSLRQGISLLRRAGYLRRFGASRLRRPTTSFCVVCGGSPWLSHDPVAGRVSSVGGSRCQPLGFFLRRPARTFFGVSGSAASCRWTIGYSAGTFCSRRRKWLVMQVFKTRPPSKRALRDQELIALIRRDQGEPVLAYNVVFDPASIGAGWGSISSTPAGRCDLSPLGAFLDCRPSSPVVPLCVWQVLHSTNLLMGMYVRVHSP